MSGNQSVLISDSSDHFGVFSSYSVSTDNEKSAKMNSLKLRMVLNQDSLLKYKNELANSQSVVVWHLTCEDR